MKIVIPGGSGQVGTILARAFHGGGHEVVVLSRRPQVRAWRVVPWDGRSLGHWQREVDGCDVVINLAGRSVNCRYTPANREAILQSRVLSTRVVGEAIARAVRPPRVWLQASTATIYAHHRCRACVGTRVCGGFRRRRAQARPRSAMTLSPDPEGVFETLLGLTRRGLGGRAGDGRQFMSWIHYEDFVAAVRWLIDRDDIDGIVNVASPNPVPNAEFMRVLRQARGIPFGLPASRWMLEIGAVFMRTETELILKSRRVVPARLLEHGFGFKYPDWPSAAGDLCQRSKIAGGQPRMRD